MSIKHLAILTLWRDSESYIVRSLSQFESMESQLQSQNINCIYGFFENDSTDSTPNLLQHWLKDRIGFVISEHIGAPKWGSIPSNERTQYLARYRNITLDYLNNYYNFDYLLVADSDVHWEPTLISEMIQRLDDNPTWGMVSPNTTQNVQDFVGCTESPSYFDSWALIDSNGTQAMTFAANPFLSPRDRLLWENGQPVPVNSAFGSISLVRAAAIDEDSTCWDGENGCEHWYFCESIRDAGYQICVDPTLHAEIKHEETINPHPDIIAFHQKRLKHHTEHQFYNTQGNQEFSITFGICTGYTNSEHLIKCVESIRAQNLDDYEILLIGPKPPSDLQTKLEGPDLEFLLFDETVRPLWITKKKNLLAQQATFERLCLLHDYLTLSPDWATNLRTFESQHPWSVLAFPQQRLDGGRFWYDWSGFDGPRELDNRQFYDYTDWSHNDDVYISGNIFCVNRFLLLDFPFNENLSHMGEEDLEWTKRIQSYVHFKCAHNSLVHHQKTHRDQKFFTQLDQKV